MSDIAQLENLIHLGHYAQARTRAQDLLEREARRVGVPRVWFDDNWAVRSDK